MTAVLTKFRCLGWALSVLPVLVFSVVTCPAQELRTSRATSTDAAIRVDGILDEPAWNETPPASGFFQRDPEEGQPATEQTEVRILYTKKSLFFGIRCHDSDPARVLATELRRDNEFINDDVVSILLDTLHDHRSGYLFRINPLGAKYDALVTDEGRLTDANWDESWSTGAKITDDGWTAEVEIPFKVLRLGAEEEQIWGVDFERVIRRKNEFTYWSNYKRGFDFKQVSQAGQLTGLRNLSAGLTLRIKPFVRSSLTQASTGAGMKAETHSLSDIGLEDVKYRITSDFTADFTVNTDFAEADVDAQVLNLTRFPVFFPEKREFFVEGGGIFDYGPGGGAASELKLFFSRRIGLSPDRESIPIRGGGKLTGKSGSWTVGLLDVQTGAFGKIPQRNFAVARVKKDVLSRSNVGLIATNRDSATPGDPYNRGFGGDANFVFFEHFNIQSFATSTYTPEKDKDHWAGRVRSYWDSDFLGADIEHLVIQRDYNPEMGWLPRGDMRKSKFQFDLKPRPNSRLVRQLFFRSNVDYITNQAGQLETRNQDFTFESLFQSGDRVVLRYSHLFDRIKKAFSVQSRVSVLPGDYTWESAQLRLTQSPNRRFSGDVSVRQQWGFYGGANTEVSWSPIWKASRNLSVAPAYQFNRVSLPAGRFTSHLINSQVNYAFNDRWLTASTVQYNGVARLVAVNFRLNYLYRLNDHFFLIYNESRTRADGTITGPWSRSVIAKLTHTWDF